MLVLPLKRLIIVCAANMKQSTAGNPSRNEVLNWINAQVEAVIGPVRRIEDLGNGAAYLVLIMHHRPGSVKLERIIRSPANHGECMQNLKLVSTLLERLALGYTIEPDRLAQMKYQDNFYFASFLFKTLPNYTEPLNASTSNENVNAKFKKIKIVPPAKVKPQVLSHEAPPDFTVEDLEALGSGSKRKLREIEQVLEDSNTSSAKLDKIAKILNLAYKRKEKKSVETMTQDVNLGSLSIEASYKRYLRPSLCERSSFLNNAVVPMSFEKAEKPKRDPAHRPIPMAEILPESQFQGDLLLSQKKDEQMLLSQRKEQWRHEDECLLQRQCEESGERKEGGC